MGEELSAEEAWRLGVVGEVLAPPNLLPRAMTIAADLARKPPLVRRYARLAVIQRYKRLLEEGLELGLAVEALAALSGRPSEGRMRDLG